MNTFSEQTGDYVQKSLKLIGIRWRI